MNSSTACLNLLSRVYRSASHLAARAGALDVLEVLLEDLDKADKLEYVNAADKSGITPVFLAKQKGMLRLKLFQ